MVWRLLTGAILKAELPPFPHSISGAASVCATTMTAPTADRPLRADARRNRDKLLSAATEAFATEGQDVPLETIAERAGVGIGTLYRHFPNRDALVVAAYQRE